jgi:formylglycine-generating enzyme required for sulfatase activity
VADTSPLTPPKGTVCPFVGLVPFTEEQSRFFFGRERETRLVVNNLFAERLTLLYGPSGVGKSSLLRAGVMAQIAAATRDDDEPAPLVVYMKEWQGDVMARFRVAVETAVLAAWPEDDVSSSEGLGVAAWLGMIADVYDVDVFVVLDQFEEYFLYHSEETATVREPFARELATAVKTRGLPVSFLLGLRDDALARLDRFKVLIPDLFVNYLRLEPLSEEQAERAVREPVREYNETAEGPAVEIEDDLVAAVLEQVRKGEVEVGPGGRGRVSGKLAGIEAPYLQLVMTRIWEHEQRVGSSILRASTLTTLGGARKIVQDHLGQTMESLSEDERGICVHMFQHLVTPSGTKIAHSAADLAKWAGEPVGTLERLLMRLSGTGMRILVSVAPVDAVGAERYEIYHDALGQAMLDWRERRVGDEQRAEITKWRRLVVGLVVAMVLALVAVGVAWVQYGKAKDNAARAAEKEQEAQKSAEEARAQTQVATDLTRELQEERDEQARKDVEALELAGKFDEAEKLRVAAAERSQSLEQRLGDLDATVESRAGDLSTLQSRLQEMTAERDAERMRSERAATQLTAARTEIQVLERQVKDLTPLETENGIGMRLRRIRAGTFQMGSPPGELDRHTSEVFRQVTLTRDFWMAETEVTQGEWEQLVEVNPSAFKVCGDNCPVENVNWFEAVEFANRLSEHEGLDKCYGLDSCTGTPGKEDFFSCGAVSFVGLDCGGYRLPTEAEWEYATRAGTTTPFWTGENLTTDQANSYGKNSKGARQTRQTTVSVRSFDANPWGLYEVHGNVWEWVWDSSVAWSKDAVTDPEPGLRWGGTGQVIRGGSWNSEARGCRSASGFAEGSDSHTDSLGFRLLRTYP